MRILYVTQELDPFTAISEVSESFKKLPQYVNDRSHEIRVLMPKYGLINERRHRLHEVVRLSGMNIIVDDEDYPLIIKVASLPGARIQVYFLDNEEFFKRKNAFVDDDNQSFADNHERMVFFCKGVMETVKKFGWPPEIIHCLGTFTSLVPLFVKKVYHTDPIFSNSKVIFSSFTDLVGQTLNKGFKEIAAINDLNSEDLNPYIDGIMMDLNGGAINYSDGVILETQDVFEYCKNKAEALNVSILDRTTEEKDLADVVNFYKTFIEAEK